MKVRLGADIKGSYVFNPVAKTVTFSGLSDPVTLDSILLITNTADNTIIYNFADSARGAASFSDGVLTLTYDTSSMSATDPLQIFLDMPTYNDTVEALLRRLNKILESNTIVDGFQRQKVVVEAVGNNRGTPTEAAGAIPVSGTVTATASGTYNINTALATQLVPNAVANPYTLASQATTNVFEGPVHQLWRVADDARNTYSASIRSRLSFT